MNGFTGFLVHICISALLVLLAGPAFVEGSAEQVEDPQVCRQCAMERTRYPESRMLVIYADGTRVGVCSIHCATDELLKNSRRQVKSLLVADYTTQKLIDTTASTWVVGGKPKGVMTFEPKWAFARKQDAQVFTKKFGGKIVNFDQVMKLAVTEVRSTQK